MPYSINPDRPGEFDPDGPDGQETDKSANHPDRVTERPLADLKPSPENLGIYKPVRPDDDGVRDLAASIGREGVLEPLVVSADGFLLSGHRRKCAAELAGLTVVPVRVLPVSTDDPVRLRTLLREFNRSRDKTRTERAREAIIDVDPREAYQALIERRDEQSTAGGGPALDLGAVKKRGEIGPSKEPMLASALEVLTKNRRYWPLSIRAIHYRLLNDPPWRSVLKNGQGRNRYANDRNSYKDLSKLLTDARIGGRIEKHVIHDITRSVTTWSVHPNPAAFLVAELNSFLRNYRRDQMAAQPDHVELVVEKNTVQAIAKRAAGRYGVPVTVARGKCSLPPRQDVADRFEASGKGRLVMLMASDLDPDGEVIARSFARSLRDDFGLNPHAVKVALTIEQVRDFGLPPGGDVKAGSTEAAAYVKKYGTTDTWELEALEPAALERLIRNAIEDATDPTIVNEERAAEEADAALLEGVREAVRDAAWEALDEAEAAADDLGDDDGEDE